MPMREDCRHYETRTYSAGETVHMCRLDLAPDAPWRCPDNCPKYQRRTFDAGWTQGSLGRRVRPDDPPRIDYESSAILDQAEEIINAAGPGIMDQVSKQKGRGQSGAGWKGKLKKRRKKR